MWSTAGRRSWTYSTCPPASNFGSAPGTRFYYASIEADVLGLVLRSAVGKSISEYLYEKIWEPIGAEADATWLVDSLG